MSKRSNRRKTKNVFQFFIDKIVYIVAIFGIVVYIPQLTLIWIGKRATGLSLISWVGFTIGSIVWLFYGIIHKQKPLVIMNLLLAIIQFIIVIGIFMYQ